MAAILHGVHLYTYLNPMTLTSLECQVSAFGNSDACPRPTIGHYAIATHLVRATNLDIDGIMNCCTAGYDDVLSSCTPNHWEARHPMDCVPDCGCLPFLDPPPLINLLQSQMDLAT